MNTHKNMSFENPSAPQECEETKQERELFRQQARDILAKSKEGGDEILSENSEHFIEGYVELMENLKREVKAMAKESPPVEIYIRGWGESASVDSRWSESDSAKNLRENFGSRPNLKA